ncbi:hypothetical protein MBANPS3_006929 [Mucor bainieri]
MPTTWKSLPLEIERVVDLMESRLVCKAWDPLAEKAMFSKTLRFPKYKSTAAKLHYHLAKKPFLGRCIKKVHVDFFLSMNEVDFADPLIAELCQLVFTPEIEKIYGCGMEDNFFEMLLDVMEDSPQKFDHLREISGWHLPVANEDHLAYSQVLCKFKDTLEKMDLTLCSDSTVKLMEDCLDEFVKLKDVTLTLKFYPGIEAIDTILRKLQKSVKELSLQVIDADDFSAKTKREMNAWLTQHVEKNENMKTVYLIEFGDERYSSNVMDYVVHKYSKLQKLALVITDMGRHLIKILRSTGQIPHVQILETYTQQPEDLWMLGYSLKSTTNKIRIRYSPYLCMMDKDGAQIEITKKNDTQYTDFDITFTPEVSHALAKQLLSSVSTGTSDITELDINLYLYKDAKDESEHEMTFYNILKMAPHTQALKFCDKMIKHQTTDLDTLTLNDLRHLQIFAAKIDARVLSHISKIAPKLRFLDISSSCLLDADGQYRDNMHIDMPHSDLNRIVMETRNHDDNQIERPELDALEIMENEINAIGNIYLYVKTANSLEQHFVLESDQNTINILSKEEYELHSKGSAIMYINCSSLKLLRIDLDDYYIEMSWDAHGDLLPGGRIINRIR